MNFNLDIKNLRLLFLIVIVTILINLFYLKGILVGRLRNLDSLVVYHEVNAKRLLCMVLTTEKSILTRGVAIWNTWGRECDEIIFACNCANIMKLKQAINNNESDEYSKFESYKKAVELPILQLDIVEDYNKMGEKVLLVMKLAYEKYAKKVDWYFMVDDDAYVFVENLNDFTFELNTKLPFMYGFKYKHKLNPHGYIGGGSGILLTNESMNRLVNKINSNQCDKYMNKYGDITIGGCAIDAGIKIGNSSDETGKPRFHYLDPYLQLNGPLPEYLYTSGTHNGKIGKGCCSLKSISFHYVKEELMYKIYDNKRFLEDLFG